MKTAVIENFENFINLFIHRGLFPFPVAAGSGVIFLWKQKQNELVWFLCIYHVRFISYIDSDIFFYDSISNSIITIWFWAILEQEKPSFFLVKLIAIWYCIFAWYLHNIVRYNSGTIILELFFLKMEGFVSLTCTKLIF